MRSAAGCRARRKAALTLRASTRRPIKRIILVVEASLDMRLIGNPVLLVFTIPLLGQQQQPSPAANFYSLEKEAVLGSALADDYRRRVPSVHDVDLRAYVSKV